MLLLNDFTSFCKPAFTQADSLCSMVTNKEGLISLIPSFFYAFKQTKARAFFPLFDSRKGGEHWQLRARVRTDERLADGNLILSNLLPALPPSSPIPHPSLLLRPAEADNLPSTSPSLPSKNASLRPQKRKVEAEVPGS